jgi:hypothetical protein
VQASAISKILLGLYPELPLKRGREEGWPDGDGEGSGEGGKGRVGEGREFVLCPRKKKEKSAPVISGLLQLFNIAPE